MRGALIILLTSDDIEIMAKNSFFIEGLNQNAMATEVEEENIPGLGSGHHPMQR